MRAWVELLAGPLAWFASLCGSLAIEPRACSQRSNLVLFAFPATALAIVVFCGGMAWLRWRAMGREFPGEAGGSVAGARALASGAVLLNGLFVLVILAQMIVPGFLGACE